MNTVTPRRSNPPPSAGAGEPLGDGAEPHGSRAASLGSGLGALAGIALLSALAACGRGGAESPASNAPASRAVEELVESFTPLDPTLTSDKHDAWLRRQREVLERLKQSGPEVGRAALEAYDRSAGQPEQVREALLEVAAYGVPLEAAPLLEQLVRNYDPSTALGLRSRAVWLLADTSPERALATLEPLVREERHHATYPPQDILVQGWAHAARELGRVDPLVLCDVAVSLFQPPEARYVAVEELGKLGGEESRRALEELLVESSADGYLRRKAAQALEAFLGKDELCALLTRVGDRETDQGFLFFVADMLQRNCP